MYKMNIIEESVFSFEFKIPGNEPKVYQWNSLFDRSVSFLVLSNLISNLFGSEIEIQDWGNESMIFLISMEMSNSISM